MVYQSQKKRRHQRWDGGGGHWAIKRRDIIYFAVLYSLGPYKSPLLSSLTREKRSINLQGHKKRKSSILHKGPVAARPAYAFANYLKNNSNSPSLWKIKRKTNGWNIYSGTIVYQMNNVIWQMRWERFGATSGQKSPKERKYHQKLAVDPWKIKVRGSQDKFLDRF